MTVEEALALSRATQDALQKANSLLERLTDGGVQRPSVLSHLVESTTRIKANLESEIAELEKIIDKLGL